MCVRGQDVCTYIESAAGMGAGGWSGLMSVVTGSLFLLSIPLVSFVSVIPMEAVATALIIVEAMTFSLVQEADWDQIDKAVPALLTIAGKPLMFSISDGLSMGVISHSALKIPRGKAGSIFWLVQLLAAVRVALCLPGLKCAVTGVNDNSALNQ